MLIQVSICLLYVHGKFFDAPQKEFKWNYYGRR